MAFDIIYKGELNGQQLDIQTGLLTEISTFSSDVRSAAIQNSIGSSTTIGASQAAILAMSGDLAASAHPSVNEAADVSINNSAGNVIQDVTLTIDDNGHVTEATFGTVNLDGRYFTESEVTGISGDLQSSIDILNTATGSLSSEIDVLQTNTGTLRNDLDSAESDISVLEAATGTLRADITSNDGELDTLRAATGTLRGDINSNDSELNTLRTATGHLEGEINDLQTVSGALRTDITSNDGELTTLRAATGALRNDLDSAESSIGVLETATGSLSSEIDVLQTATGSLEGEINTLNTATGTLRSDINSNDSELATLRAATGTLRGDINTNDGELDVLRTATGHLKGVTDTNTGDIYYLSGLINNLETNSGTNTLDQVTSAGPSTTNDITVGDIRVSGGSITGPSTITIDPDAAGAAGLVVIAGDLQVDGTTTTIKSSEIQVGDKNLVLGTGASNDAAMDGGGIILSGTAGQVAEFTYDGSHNVWTSDVGISGDLSGVALEADKWSTARSITFAGGDVTGQIASIDGSSNVGNVDLTIAPLSVTNGMLAGSIANSKLTNKTIGIGAGSGLAGGGTPELGGSATVNVGAGEAIAVNADSIDVKYDNDTIGLDGSNRLYVKGNSIGSDEIGNGAVNTLQIANDAVTSDKLASSVAGTNITFTNGVLSVPDSTITGAVGGVIDSFTASKAIVSDSNGYLTDSQVTTTQLNYVSGVTSSIQTQLNSKAATSTLISAGNGLAGGGSLASNRTLSVSSDQGHLDEIELGTDDASFSNVVTKGGILILKGNGASGISVNPSSDEVAIALNDKTTVGFEGIVQSARTDQDSDDGSYVAMWKVQGVLRRDSNSTNMLQSFVTQTFAGANATGYGLDVSVDGTNLKIASDQSSLNLITSATINYNWIEDAS